jgi:hypothetical protein
MLVVMTKWATLEEIDAVVAAIQKNGYTARPIPWGKKGNYRHLTQQRGCALVCQSGFA